MLTSVQKVGGFDSRSKVSVVFSHFCFLVEMKMMQRVIRCSCKM